MGMTDAPSYALATFATDPESGERLVVEHDENYSILMGAFSSGYCRHPERGTFRFKVSNGSTQVRECCTACGQAFGTALSQKDKGWVETLPWLADGMSANYFKEREADKRRLLLDLARKQYVERGAFTNSYTTYLTSPEWAAKRELVLKRCGGVCEGCGVSPATEVHHRHYDHLFNEFLFELSGLCHGCHERITLERRERQEAAISERAAQFDKYGR